MRTSAKWTVASLLAMAAVSLTAFAAEGWVTYNSKPGTGTLVSVEGTSTLHDWRVEGKIIAGRLQVGTDFPTDPANAKPGQVKAKANVIIPVRSLKSVKNGKPYSEKMDDIMYEKLLEKTHKQIKYSLKEMTLKEAPSSADGAFKFETKGDLTVAGATHEVVMPVEMKVKGKQLLFSGKIESKMTDFKVEPVSALGGTIKTGDEITLQLAWTTQTR